MDFIRGNPPTVTAGTEQTNPTAGTVIVDSGALPAGTYLFYVSIGASAAAQFQVQRRDAANGSNVGNPALKYIAAGQSAQFVYQTVLESNERVRVTMDDNLTGTAVADLVYQRLV